MEREPATPDPNDTEPLPVEVEEDPNADPVVVGDDEPGTEEVPSDPDANEVADLETKEIEESIAELTGQKVAKPAAKPGEAEAEAEEPTGDGVDVLVPTPGWDTKGGSNRAAEFEFKNVPKEAADAIRYHIRQSEQVPVLQAQVENAAESIAVTQLIDVAPLQALHLIVERHAKRPEIADQFVKSWLRLNPEKALNFIQEEGFESADERTLRERSENEKLKIERHVERARDGVGALMAEQRASNNAAAIVVEASNTLGFEDGEERELFDTRCSTILRKALKEDPSITRAEMRERIEPVIRTFRKLTGRTPAPVAPANGKGKDDGKKTATASAPVAPASVVRRKVETARVHEKIGSGRSVIAPLGFTRPKPGDTIDDVNKRLRGH